MAAPVINNISNLSGTPGAQIRVGGTNLDTVTDVMFGGGVSATVLSKGLSYLTFEVPAGAQSDVITITNPDGSVQTSNFIVTKPIQPPLQASSTRSWKLNWGLVLGGLAFALGVILAILFATTVKPDFTLYAKNEEVEKKLAGKADKSDVPNTDAIVTSVSEVVEHRLQTYATKTLLDEKLATKADKADFDALNTKVNDPKTGLDTKVDEEKAREILQQACAEREAEKKKKQAEWWKNHGKDVMARKETERLQERELIKTELLKELRESTTFTPDGKPVPVGIKSIELVPDDS